MTRFKLTPWLAIPALLLLGPMMTIANAAPPQVSMEDGIQVIRLDRAPAWLDRAMTTDALTTSMTPGEVTVAQYGDADALVSNRNRFVSVRFDLPFSTPYTISALSFPSRVLIPNPALPFASFRSVRVVGADAGGNLDTSQEYFRFNRYQGNNDGTVANSIPLNILVSDPGKTFYAVFEFPAPVTGVADTFPFMFSDAAFMDKGLFANSYASDTTGAVTAPPTPGTISGTTLLANHNLIASLTCTLSENAPLNAPSNLGLNLRTDQATWDYVNPSDVAADGTIGHLTGVELVRRGAGWDVVAATGAGQGRVILPSVPGSGLQIWATRSISQGGERGVSSNVTITGPSAVVAMLGMWGEDADEPNGRSTDVEATSILTPDVRAASIWPAGDVDNYSFFAHPGAIVTATASPTGIDFVNDLDPVVQLLDNNGDVLGVATAPSPGQAATLMMAIPPKGNSTALHRFVVQVVDKSGSDVDQASAPRALVPPTYGLSVDLQTPAVIQQFGPSEAPVSSLLDPDQFAFANAGANPVRGNATFGFVIPRSEKSGVSVKLRIYDVRGRSVSTLVNGVKAAGTHFASWSGHDSRGNRMASGAYFARIEAGSYSRTVRIDLLK